MSARIVSVSVAACFGVGLLLRVAYLAHVDFQTPIRSDARQYVVYGYNLVAHGTFSKELAAADPTPDSFRSPGFPALIALAVASTGDGALADPDDFLPRVLAIQALLSALLAPLTYALGRRFLPAGAALAAAGGVALSPHLVTLSGYLLTETLFAFWLLVGLLAFVDAWSKASRRRFAMAGVAFGAAQLTNATALFVPLVLVAAATAIGPPGADGRLRGAIRRGAGVFLAVYLVFPVAWSIRDATQVPPGSRTSEDRAFATLTHGIYPGWVHDDPTARYYAYRTDPQRDEIQASLGGLVGVVWERIRERPVRYASWFLLEKPYYGWSWSILQGQGDIYVYPVEASLYYDSAAAEASRWISWQLHPLLLALALASAVLLGRAARRHELDDTWRVPALLVGLALYYTALFTVFTPWPRYGIPLRPALYLLAMFSAARGWAHFVAWYRTRAVADEPA